MQEQVTASYWRGYTQAIRDIETLAYGLNLWSGERQHPSQTLLIAANDSQPDPTPNKRRTTNE